MLCVTPSNREKRVRTTDIFDDVAPVSTGRVSKEELFVILEKVKMLRHQGQMVSPSNSING